MICLVEFANLFRETSPKQNSVARCHGEIRPQETQCHEGFPEGEREKTHAPLGFVCVCVCVCVFCLLRFNTRRGFHTQWQTNLSKMTGDQVGELGHMRP